jgi:hypothetical protein
MCLDRLFHDLGSQLQEVLWDEETCLSHVEIDRLHDVVAEDSAALDRQRALLDELGERVAAKEQRAAWLFERVEIYLHVGDEVNAWRHALDLDQLRQSLEADRRKLDGQRQFHQMQLTRFRRLQQHLDDLHNRLYKTHSPWQTH